MRKVSESKERGEEVAKSSDDDDDSSSSDSSSSSEEEKKKKKKKKKRKQKSKKKGKQEKTRKEDEKTTIPVEAREEVQVQGENADVDESKKVVEVVTPAVADLSNIPDEARSTTGGAGFYNLGEWVRLIDSGVLEEGAFGGPGLSRRRHELYGFSIGFLREAGAIVNDLEIVWGSIIKIHDDLMSSRLVPFINFLGGFDLSGVLRESFEATMHGIEGWHSYMKGLDRMIFLTPELVTETRTGSEPGSEISWVEITSHWENAGSESQEVLSTSSFEGNHNTSARSMYSCSVASCYALFFLASDILPDPEGEDEGGTKSGAAGKDCSELVRSSSAHLSLSRSLHLAFP